MEPKRFNTQELNTHNAVAQCLAYFGFVCLSRFFSPFAIAFTVCHNGIIAAKWAKHYIVWVTYHSAKLTCDESNTTAMRVDMESGGKQTKHISNMEDKNEVFIKVASYSLCLHIMSYAQTYLCLYMYFYSICAFTLEIEVNKILLSYLG